jgi:hypothetical protein
VWSCRFAHRADERLVILHQRCKRRIRRTVAVEVCAQREDDHRLCVLLCGVRQQFDEKAALLLVAAEREHLFCLVDDQDDLGVR